MPPTFSILIADDSPDDVALLQQALKETAQGRFHEISLHHTADGEEAVSLIRETQNLCLVVLDQYLPKRNGTEVLQLLHAQGAFPTCPIVILTSHVSDSQRQEFAQAGVSNVRTKPMDWDGYVALAGELTGFCLPKQTE